MGKSPIISKWTRRLNRIHFLKLSLRGRRIILVTTLHIGICTVFRTFYKFYDDDLDPFLTQHRLCGSHVPSAVSA